MVYANYTFTSKYKGGLYKILFKKCISNLQNANEYY